MWFDFIVEGLKKFAGEIIGAVLIIVALRFFPKLKSLFTKAEDLIYYEDRDAEFQSQTVISDRYFLKLCEAGEVWEVEDAIIKGAHINAKDGRDCTTLMYAVERGHTEIVKILLKHGVVVNAKNDSGGTALMYAAKIGHIEIVKLLLEHGANTNSKAKGGKVFGNCLTALMYAAEGGHTEVAELLLRYGAIINAKDKKGCTALMYADYYGHSETANLLRSYGAKE